MAVSKISGSRFAVVEGTLPRTTSTWSDVVSYPAGFTQTNSVLAGFSVKTDTFRTGQGLASPDTGRVFAELAPGGVRAYSTDSHLASSPYKVVLMKNS